MKRAVAVLSTLIVLSVAGSAQAKVHSYTLRYGPINLIGFETVFPGGKIDRPKGSGYVVGMHARLVDRKGRPVTIRDVMLHHVYFHRLRTEKANTPCAGKTAEAFYGTGEENETLAFPSGYGYRLRKSDRWRMGAMLMSHTTENKNVYVQYTVKVEEDKRLTPVHAFWLRANGCGDAAGYYINGDGVPGSTTDAVLHWTVPRDMKLIAAGGHLHGGAKDMFLSQPRCGDRRLLDNKPSYAMPDNLYYRARPILHEPGPIDTRWFLSGQGIQVSKGETIDLHGVYEATYPRTVMSVMHLYAVDAKAAPNAGCQPLPADVKQLTKAIPTRPDPPYEDIPLTGLDKSGRTFTITDPPWPVAPLPVSNAVKVSDAGFSPQRFTVPANTKVTWDFEGAAGHNVRLAAGPRLVVTPTYPRGGVDATTFSVPGTYTLFCTRHPVTMHAEVQVVG